MATGPWTDLLPATVPDPTDIVCYTHDPSGTPESKVATVEDFIASAVGLKFKHVPLTNDDIKALGSNNTFGGGGKFGLIAGKPNTIYMLQAALVRCTYAVGKQFTNIVDGATLFIGYSSDVAPYTDYFFEATCGLRQVAGGQQAIGNLLGNSAGGPTAFQYAIPNFRTRVPATPAVAEMEIVGIEDASDPIVGKSLVFLGTNGDSTDYTGGDAANSMDVYLWYYEITV